MTSYYFENDFIKQSCVAIRSASGSGLGSGDGVPISILMVGRGLLNFCFEWPFVVPGESGRCLEISSYVSIGQVAR